MIILDKMNIEYILPTFNRSHELKSALSCLMAQTNSSWIANVIVDNPVETVADDIVKEFNDKRICITHSDKRYNDWGHSLRQIGKQKSLSDYIIMTGDDGYYTPNTVKEILLAAESSPGMIYWDMIHSHYNYQYFKCSPAFNQIDMGAFATRTDLAKQIKLGTNYAADGNFVEDFKKKFPNEKIVKINKVLFVHN